MVLRMDCNVIGNHSARLKFRFCAQEIPRSNPQCSLDAAVPHSGSVTAAGEDPMPDIHYIRNIHYSGNARKR